MSKVDELITFSLRGPDNPVLVYSASNFEVPHIMILHGTTLSAHRLVTAEFLAYGQFFQRFPPALLAIGPGERCGERWHVDAPIYRPAQLNETISKLTHPACVRLRVARTKSHSLTVGEQSLQTFFEEGLIVETAVSALAPVGAGKGDVLPGICPSHLIALVLHDYNKTLSVIGVFQSFVDSLDQIQLPAVGPEASLILTGLHPLLLRILLRLL